MFPKVKNFIEITFVRSFHISWIDFNIDKQIFMSWTAFSHSEIKKINRVHTIRQMFLSFSSEMIQILNMKT